MKKSFVKSVSAVAVATSLFGAVSPSVSAAVLGDDYPSSWKNAAADTLVDKWTMYNRECTSFAAFRLSSANGFNLPAGYGNANTWGHIARKQGYRVDMNPAVGSIAWFDSYVGYSGSAGHVSWVANVNGDQVELEEYNYNIGQGPHRYSRRTIHKSQVSGFIHFKDMAGGTNSSSVNNSVPSGTLAASGTYRFDQTKPVKAAANMSSQEVASYSAGQSVTYDKVVEADGYKWISYIGGSGLRRYIPVQKLASSNPSGKLTISNINNQTGSFDVTVTDMVSPGGVKEVKLPTWSTENGQDDIIWYSAPRQADGSYKLHVDSSKHKNSLGEYNVHLYYVQDDGKLVGAGGTTTTVTKTQQTTKTQTANINVGDTVAFKGVYKVYNNLAGQVTSSQLAGGTPGNLNIIDPGPLVETDAAGNRSGDQILLPGNYFIVPGQYKVLQVDRPSNGIYVRIGSRNVWLDMGQATKV
ncbi:GBS Bsp-like repeat-containing protein [Streptococcus massiliensis]|uniref:N-acetylmuramoyl-L-alanine amidase n=1 Tax=Streptococcus massiliensis TaxID=313439 RepID=A0A380KYK3_9STRE|nr:GBS Bsp-like repeat-containing protein [Streptococcus massiliensis]SUN76174.1 putative cell wall associated protein [Streptococcus massiliensis]